MKKKYYFNIEAQDIDFRRRVSLKSLTNMVLIAAGKNADENGFGVLDLQTEQYTWVLTRLALEMERVPNEKDSLCIETWIESIGTAFTTRNFVLRDATGTIIGYAASTWAVIDMRTRHSVRLDTLPSMRKFIVPESTPIGEPARVPSAKGEVANCFEVKYSEIDVNGHVNSLNYVQWVSDCFSLEFYKRHYIRRFEINFLKEITYGDTGEVSRELIAPGDCLFQIDTRDKGASCRARLLFFEPNP